MSKNRKHKKEIPEENNIFIPKFTEEELEQKEEYDKKLAKLSKLSKAKTEETPINVEMLLDYANEDKYYNGFGIFMAFAVADQIYEININDVQRNLLALKQVDKYQELLKSYTYNSNGQFMELVIDIYVLANSEKLIISSSNGHTVYPNISFDEVEEKIKSISQENQKLMFSLVSDYRKLNSIRYEEKDCKKYNKAI